MPYASVLFDCDSTLSAIEGIDELAAGHKDEVAGLTNQAMRGELPLEAVYGRRLAIVRPTREQVRALAARYIERMVPDAREAFAALRAEGVTVRIISAGVRAAVCALARELGLNDDAVAAVDVFFDEGGAYAGYDDGSPLTRSGGKRAVLERWLAGGGLARPVMFVGDGATDLETRPVVDRFVAFAGVIERPAVLATADVIVRANSLAPIVTLALDGKPPARPESRAVYDKGLAMLNAPSMPTPPQGRRVVQ